MRVVLIGPVYPYRGGIAHYTTRLASALRARGHMLSLISFKRMYPRIFFPGQSDRDPSQEPLKAEDAHYWIDSLNPLTWLATFRRIRAYQPDAIALQWWTAFWVPAWWVLGALNRLSGRYPLIILCHNVLPHENHWWDPWLVRAVLSWGTGFITQSLQEKELLLSLLPKARVAVCPHPVYDILSDMRISKEQARQRLKLPANTPILLFFGIVREYKGLQDLLAALPEVQEKLGSVTLVVAGEFWDDQGPYLETIRHLGIEDSVFLDARYIPNEEAAVYFSAADLLVSPYRRATGSGAVQMAVGFGLPVVATEAAGLAGANGASGGPAVPPGDPQALAAAIVRHFARSDRAPRQHATPAEHSWAQVVAAIEGLAQEGRA